MPPLKEYLVGALIANVPIILFSLSSIQTESVIVAVTWNYMLALTGGIIAGYLIAIGSERPVLYGFVLGFFSYILYVFFSFFLLGKLKGEAFLLPGFAIGGAIGGRIAEKKYKRKRKKS